MEAWEGGFGTAYTDRNVVDWHTRLPAFERMLEGLPLERVLEVGCNRGHNLLALAELLPRGELLGIEPNRHALECARLASASTPGIASLYGDVLDIPFKDGYFDLVFTAGVLIHLRLSDLATAMKEICRVSRRYVLAIEYFADEETAVPYRGRADLLWKRDFLKHYHAHCPEFELVRSGFWGPEFGFDRTHWWLLEKHECGAGGPRLAAQTGLKSETS